MKLEHGVVGMEVKSKIIYLAVVTIAKWTIQSWYDRGLLDARLGGISFSKIVSHTDLVIT